MDSTRVGLNLVNLLYTRVIQPLSAITAGNKIATRLTTAEKLINLLTPVEEGKVAFDTKKHAIYHINGDIEGEVSSITNELDDFISNSDLTGLQEHEHVIYVYIFSLIKRPETLWKYFALYSRKTYTLGMYQFGPWRTWDRLTTHDFPFLKQYQIDKAAVIHTFPSSVQNQMRQSKSATIPFESAVKAYYEQLIRLFFSHTTLMAYTKPNTYNAAKSNIDTAVVVCNTISLVYNYAEIYFQHLYWKFGIRPGDPNNEFYAYLSDKYGPQQYPDRASLFREVTTGNKRLFFDKTAYVSLPSKYSDASLQEFLQIEEVVMYHKEALELIEKHVTAQSKELDLFVYNEIKGMISNASIDEAQKLKYVALCLYDIENIPDGPEVEAVMLLRVFFELLEKSGDTSKNTEEYAIALLGAFGDTWFTFEPHHQAALVSMFTSENESEIESIPDTSLITLQNAIRHLSEPAPDIHAQINNLADNGEQQSAIVSYLIHFKDAGYSRDDVQKLWDGMKPHLHDHQFQEDRTMVSLYDAVQSNIDAAFGSAPEDSLESLVSLENYESHESHESEDFDVEIDDGTSEGTSEGTSRGTSEGTSEDEDGGEGEGEDEGEAADITTKNAVALDGILARIRDTNEAYNSDFINKCIADGKALINAVPRGQTKTNAVLELINGIHDTYVETNEVIDYNDLHARLIDDPDGNVHDVNIVKYITAAFMPTGSTMDNFMANLAGDQTSDMDYVFLDLELPSIQANNDATNDEDDIGDISYVRPASDAAYEKYKAYKPLQVNFGNMTIAELQRSIPADSASRYEQQFLTWVRLVMHAATGQFIGAQNSYTDALVIDDNTLQRKSNNVGINEIYYNRYEENMDEYRGKAFHKDRENRFKELADTETDQRILNAANSIETFMKLRGSTDTWYDYVLPTRRQRLYVMQMFKDKPVVPQTMRLVIPLSRLEDVYEMWDDEICGYAQLRHLPRAADIAESVCGSTDIAQLSQAQKSDLVFALQMQLNSVNLKNAFIYTKNRDFYTFEKDSEKNERDHYFVNMQERCRECCSDALRDASKLPIYVEKTLDTFNFSKLPETFEPSYELDAETKEDFDAEYGPFLERLTPLHFLVATCTTTSGTFAEPYRENVRESTPFKAENRRVFTASFTQRIHEKGVRTYNMVGIQLKRKHDSDVHNKYYRIFLDIDMYGQYLAQKAGIAFNFDTDTVELTAQNLGDDTVYRINLENAEKNIRYPVMTARFLETCQMMLPQILQDELLGDNPGQHINDTLPVLRRVEQKLDAGDVSPVLYIGPDVHKAVLAGKLQRYTGDYSRLYTFPKFANSNRGKNAFVNGGMVYKREKKVPIYGSKGDETAYYSIFLSFDTIIASLVHDDRAFTLDNIRSVARKYQAAYYKQNEDVRVDIEVDKFNHKKVPNAVFAGLLKYDLDDGKENIYFHTHEFDAFNFTPEEIAEGGELVAAYIEAHYPEESTPRETSQETGGTDSENSSSSQSDGETE